ncbi:MAG: UDP-N-acetylglucosamine 2-epimerase (non-hydrolyzing) [Bacteroidota bacterium]|nr:UDP-N-acetylglucosamine 2-epimerase (non-hydrolyzing) [Bacteroidota bacterium]
MKKILIVVGTRPNFIKITQFKRVFDLYPNQFNFKLVHTGQHYDYNMADVFFSQLKIQKPDYFLNVSEGSPTSKIAHIILGIEQIIDEYNPNIVMVVGDVDSTFAAAFATYKKGVTLAHLESGLRSRDRAMPEEINRILTDEISDMYFVTEQSGVDNLISEGKKSSQIHFVGNTMIDTLIAFRNDIQHSDILGKLNINPKQYCLMTMHRPSNVDDKQNFELILNIIGELGQLGVKVVFPLHPRSMKKADEFGLLERLKSYKHCVLTEPLDYFSFQKLISESLLVLTDSGGIQEETTYCGVPCLTLRKNTERPCTLEIGTNVLLEFDLKIITSKVKEIIEGKFKKGSIPQLWDGKATERIVDVLKF